MTAGGVSRDDLARCLGRPAEDPPILHIDSLGEPRIESQNILGSLPHFVGLVLICGTDLTQKRAHENAKSHSKHAARSESLEAPFVASHQNRPISGFSPRVSAGARLQFP